MLRKRILLLLVVLLYGCSGEKSNVRQKSRVKTIQIVNVGVRKNVGIERKGHPTTRLC